MKKFISLVLACLMVFVLCACSESAAPVPAPEPGPAPDALSTVKVGFIYLHDEQSTYDLNFLNAAKEACEKLGVEYINKTGIPEGNECYEAAAELVDSGCNIIFADSFGHEDYMVQAAKDYPNVQFCHATGVKAHTENLPNYHNAFASLLYPKYEKPKALSYKKK